MVTTKRCAWGTCSNDSRLPHLLKKNANGDEVFFLHFSGSKYHGEKRRRWIQACHRGDGSVCTNYSYICSLHFVGKNGPTAEYPDPTSAVISTEHVSLYFIHDSLKGNSSLKTSWSQIKDLMFIRVFLNYFALSIKG